MKSFVAATMTKDEAKFSSRFTGLVPTSWQRRRREQNLAFCVSANRIRGLSGVAGKNRHDSVSRKPQGVVLTGGRLHVLNEFGRGAQKAVQAPAGDFWKISTRVKRVDCRSASHRAANVPGMTGKADEVASVCSERDGEYDRLTGETFIQSA